MLGTDVVLAGSCCTAGAGPNAAEIPASCAVNPTRGQGDHLKPIDTGRNNVIVLPAVVHTGEAIRVLGKENPLESIVGNDAANCQNSAMVEAHVDINVSSFLSV